MRREAALSVPVVWTCPQSLWGLLVLAAAGLAYAFHPALAYLFRTWTTSEEYSFGILVPFIAAYLVWQRREQLASTPFAPNWAGVAVLAVGLAAGVVGHIATAQTVQAYALVLALAGLALALAGGPAFRLLAAPLGMLVFMLPLPDLLLRELSATLQLLSSQIGVAMIRMAGVSVYLEGNVIDLGTMKLQVVEACSGLRYMLPLLTLGCITAYFFRAPAWQRIALIVSTIPITVLMNSARIALIGVTSERFGRAAAEGFLHDFEGWAIFMSCLAVLLAEMAGFAHLSGRRFRDVFSVEAPGATPASADRRVRAVPATLRASAALLATTAIAYALSPAPNSAVPARKDFREFALQVGDWQGRPERMSAEHLGILRLDDYLNATFQSPQGAIGLYIGYYATQRHGLAAHSPTECLPADGWEMQRFERRELPEIRGASGPLAVNRVVIQKGGARQLVYYWFQQRERTLTGEYAVKAYLFWDLVTRQRSDGALVRAVTPIMPGEDEAQADRRLQGFVAGVVPRLPEFIPG